MNKPLESDWQTFRKRAPEWRERYLAGQNRQLAALFADGEKAPTEQFCAAEKKIKVVARILVDCLDHNAAKIKEYARTVEAGEDRTYSVAEVFPEYLGQENRSALRAYRTRENLTQKRLAALTGIPQHHLSEMENGKRPIGKERARKLAEALHVGEWRMLVN